VVDIVDDVARRKVSARRAREGTRRADEKGAWHHVDRGRPPCHAAAEVTMPAMQKRMFVAMNGRERVEWEREWKRS
jgi:hypothetical protein